MVLLCGDQYDRIRRCDRNHLCRKDHLHCSFHICSPGAGDRYGCCGEFLYENANIIECEKVDNGRVEYGDTVNIDWVGTLDGAEFDSGYGYDLEIGSGAMSDLIDGFEEGLVGKCVGDMVELNLKFPEKVAEHVDETLAGKDVQYIVIINYLKVPKNK